jgi:hypothetical protein
MSRFFIVALLCIASPLAVAQRAKPASKAVSRYMRDIGILYLETVEQLTNDCGRKSNIDSDCMSRWESTMAAIEDRVSVTLNDKSRKRAAGDVPFFDLLKSAKYARKFEVSIDRELREAWIKAYATCYSYAHTVALEGEYFNGDGGCGDAIGAAVHQNDTPKP